MKNKLLLPIACFQILALLGGCASGRRSFGPMLAGSGEKVPLVNSTFEDLWARHTIALKPAEPKQTQNDGSFATDNSGQQMPAQKMYNTVSFAVKATMMDSILVEAGLQQFASLASMDESEYRQFRDSYYRTHSLGDTLYIWLQLETNISEKYLEMELWDFYLTNSDGKKIKPDRVEAYVVNNSRGPQRFAGPNGSGAPPADGEAIGYAAKGVELYFASGKEDKVKLTVERRLNPDVRAEGSWDMRSLQTSTTAF